MKYIISFFLFSALVLADDFNPENHQGANWKLVQAVQKGDIPGAKAALKEGASLKITHRGFSLLVLTISPINPDDWGKPEMLKFLIEQGADATRLCYGKDKPCLHAVHYAIVVSRADWMRDLVEDYPQYKSMLKVKIPANALRSEGPVLPKDGILPIDLIKLRLKKAEEYLQAKKDGKIKTAEGEVDWKEISALEDVEIEKDMLATFEKISR